MNEVELRRVILEEIVAIAPDADPATVDPGADIRDALDLDSMDVLNLVIGLSRRLAVDIPETDYGQLVTVDGAVRYLATRTGSGGKPA